MGSHEILVDLTQFYKQTSSTGEPLSKKGFYTFDNHEARDKDLPIVEELMHG